MNKSTIYLIPTFLQEDEAAQKAIPAYIADAVKACTVFFVENEKTARRFLKKVWKEVVIDDYRWYAIHKAEQEALPAFISHNKKGDTIGIISEAGCPGVADPGQILIEAGQQHNATIKPLVGPSAILLALMASGMNGQTFQFNGYLPIDSSERKKTIKELEEYSFKKRCTQIFIETPYRNNQIIADVLNETKFCVAVDITAATETIRTKTIAVWKKEQAPDFHKRPAIFLLYAN